MKFQSLMKCPYDPNFFPDPLDPNFYCRVCNRKANSLGEYRRHCKVSHRMTLDRIKPSFAFPDTVIDTNSPNFYCSKCD